MPKHKKKHRYENGSIKRVRIIKDPKRRPTYIGLDNFYSFKNDTTDASDVFGVADMLEARDRLWDYLRHHAEVIKRHDDNSRTIYARVPIKKHLDNCCTRKEHRV